MPQRQRVPADVRHVLACHLARLPPRRPGAVWNTTGRSKSTGRAVLPVPAFLGTRRRRIRDPLPGEFADRIAPDGRASPEEAVRAGNLPVAPVPRRSEEHTSELQSLRHLVCRLLLEKKKKKTNTPHTNHKNKINTDQ